MFRFFQPRNSMPPPELHPEILLRAYSCGIFPMGEDDGTIRWYSPDPRCVIDIDNFHTPKRLARTVRQAKFELKVDADWPAVIRACAERDTTWINSSIIDAYTELNRLGFAHTVEAYNQEGKLAGGLYGVSIGGAFMGESMFHIDTDASKVCLVYLVERLKERGFILLDSQYMTAHLSRFSARMIPKQEYLMKLQRALELDCRFA